MTDRIIAEIRAALDETERVAQDAGASFLGTSGRTWKRNMISCVEDADGRLVVYGEGTPTSAQADHIALHDPERELRVVAAFQTILDLHVPGYRLASDGAPGCAACLSDRDGYEEMWEPDQWPCPTLLAVAGVYGIDASGE